MPPLVLALDLGGHAARLHAYAPSGKRLVEIEQPIETQHPAPGRVEHDADQLLAACRSALRLGLAQLGPSAVPLPLAISCQRASVLAWRVDNCQPLSPVLSWQDSRAQPRIDALRPHWPQLQQISGLRPNAFVGASKLAWLVEHIGGLSAALRAGTAVVGPLGCFLQQALLRAARPRCSFSLAQRSLLFEIERQQWSHTACEMFGLPASYLPAVEPDLQSAPFDQIEVEAVQLQCRLQAGDQNLLPAALSEHGVAPPIINLGTGAFVLCSGRSPDPRLLRSLLPDGLIAAEGTVNAAGAAFDALARRQAWSAIPWAEIGAPQADSPLCLPAPSGLGSPDWRSESRFEFSAEPDSPRAAMTAVAEGIAFLLRRNLDAMQTSGTEPVALGGGLSRSAEFCQLLADALQRELYLLSEDELSSYGAARLLWRQYGVELPVASSARHFRPTADHAVRVERRYRTWQTRFLLSE